MPPPPDFTDADTVKKWGKLESLSADELTVLDFLIPAVTQKFLNYMSRDFFVTSYDERYDGTGQTKLTVRNSPIVAVTLLTVNEVQVPQAADSIEQGFLFNDDTLYMTSGSATPTVGIPPSTLAIAPGIFSRGRQNVRIQYSAGFDPGASPLPRPLQELKIMATQQVLYELLRMRGTIGEKSKTLGQAQTVSFISDDIHPNVKPALDRYVRRTPIP